MSSPTTGPKKLLVASLKFTNETSFTYSKEQITVLASGIKNFYNASSRGLIQVTDEVFLVDVPIVGNATSVLDQGAPYVKIKYPGRDMYIIVSPFVHGDHSWPAQGYAYVFSCLITTGNHETGHILKLQHSDTWSQASNGTWTLEKMQDGLSVMSRFSSNGLASPQYYFLGWFPLNEIVNVVSLPATITLKRINNFTGLGNSVVIVDEKLTKNQKQLFISFPQETKFFGAKPCVVLHLTYGSPYISGSEKIKTFTQGYYDEQFTGLNIEIASSTSSTVTVNITNVVPTVPYIVDNEPLDNQ